MDAQNAVEATSTKPNASSTTSASRVPDSQRQKSTQASSAASVKRSPTLSRAALASSREPKSSSKPAAASATASSSSKERSRGSSTRTASPTSTRDAKASASSSRDKQDDDGGTDGNSEAETIVLSKDGSPSKPRSRKVIKHEDKDKPNGTSASSAAHSDLIAPSRRHAADRKDGPTEKKDKGDKPAGDAAEAAALPQQKKKRLYERLQPNSHQQGSARVKDTSSSLSSAPASPPRSRNPSSRPHSGSDSDRGHRTKSPKRSSSSASKDRLRPPEKLVPHKRKAPKLESDDEKEGHSARRLRLASAGAGGDGTSHSSSRAAGKDSSRNSLGNNGNANGNGSSGKASASRSHRDASQNRSLSPQPRSHRRSLSTQLQSQSSGLGLKKKRVPAPLQSMDYNSDDSSAGGSPHIRSAKLRSLATPATAESATSPAKIVPHKKHLDAHGQTFLARACARGEFDLAKQRLQERPDDLNVADFAGNTPLQIAALNGYGEIVKFLIDAGCNLDCVNYDKDTPLLDAVDNGHLDVVKLLLDAGVNPRKANVNGEEPLDRVTEDIDNCAEIRTALIEAKKKIGERRLTSEEHRHETDDLRSHTSHNPDSPQRSPAPTSRRAGTVRATKTSNHLLYMPMDDKTLRLAAGRGDEENVIRILQVRDAFDDPESMVAASRGGHDIILQMLLALGKANPDPAPISSVPPEHATPILAAIGQENIKIISLLLEQSSFDPTKRFNGSTYYEIARQRQGPNWKEEEDILKRAYDSYKKSHGGRTKDVESRRSSRAIEASDDTPSARAHKRKLSSPSQERPKKTVTGTKAATPTASGAASAAREEKGSQKRSSEHAGSRGDSKSSTAAKTKSRQRSDRSPSASNANRDSPPPTKQSTKPKKLESDSIAVSSEGEAVKPRRKKLISGRELIREKVREKEREREKQRRASIASTKAPTPPKDSSSPRDPRSDDAAADKDKAGAEKHRDRDRDRARQLKKEGLKDPASSTASEGVGKRNRLSETPPNASFSDKDISEAPIKRRKLEVDNGTSKERRPSKGSAPPDDAPAKTSAASKVPQKRRDDDDRKTPSGSKSKKREPSSDRGRQDSSKPSVSPVEKSIHVKSEDVDVEMADVSSERRSSSGASAAASAEAEAARQKEEDKTKKAEAKAQAQAAEAKKKEEEVQRRRRQEEEDEKRQKEEKRKKEEEKRKREEAEEEARLKEEAEKKKKKELEEKKKKEEEEKQKQRKKLEEEERRRKEEEQKRKEEEEKKRLEEEEKENKRRQEEEERKRKLEEEERKKREEEERLRQEQLEKEAAEEARRKLEEEERKKQEREEQERILAEKKAAEELRRRQLEEEERVRVSKLPPALRWLSLCANPKLPATAQLFKTMQGVRYDCINADATGSAEGREQWLINTQVALILGEKDLSLPQFPSWPHLPASMIAKRVIWRLEGDRYSLTDPDFYDLGRQLPGYYDGQDPTKMGTAAIEKLRREAWEKFASTDMFFVKVSDVMNIISSIPHLHNVRLALVYRELPEKESQLLTFAPTHKWKNDPNADELLGFAPGTKYFINGTLVGQHRPGMAAPCKTPPPEVRVPRRGLIAVPVDDPEFASISRAMGIDPFSFAGYAAFVVRQRNGVLPSARTTSGHVNGTARVNGSNGTGPAHATTLHSHRSSQQAVNGINGTKSG